MKLPEARALDGSVTWGYETVARALLASAIDRREHDAVYGPEEDRLNDE